MSFTKKKTFVKKFIRIDSSMSFPFMGGNFLINWAYKKKNFPEPHLTKFSFPMLKRRNKITEEGGSEAGQGGGGGLRGTESSRDEVPRSGWNWSLGGAWGSALDFAGQSPGRAKPPPPPGFENVVPTSSQSWTESRPLSPGKKGA